MKRFINILLTTACAAALFSCTHKHAFQSASYVIMEGTTFSVKEDVGTVRIPVSAYNSDGLNGTVYFKVNDGSAVQGADFTVEPASGVLTFSGNGTQYIDINVIEHAGVLTGALSFSLELTNVSGDITDIGGVYSSVVEIQDNDVVVDWDFVNGEWNATDDGSNSYKVMIKKESENTIKVENLWDEKLSITGTITFDREANTADIVFKGGQVVYVSDSYGPVGIFGINGEEFVDCPAKVTGSGIEIGPWYGVILTGQYAGYTFTGTGGGYGGSTTLTK